MATCWTWHSLLTYCAGVGGLGWLSSPWCPVDVARRPTPLTVAERYMANGPRPLFTSSEPMPTTTVKITRPIRSITAACTSSNLRLARPVDVRVGLLAVVARSLRLQRHLPPGRRRCRRPPRRAGGTGAASRCCRCCRDVRPPSTPRARSARTLPVPAPRQLRGEILRSRPPPTVHPARGRRLRLQPKPQPLTAGVVGACPRRRARDGRRVRDGGCRRHVVLPSPDSEPPSLGRFVEDDASLTTRIRDVPDTSDTTPE